MTEPNAFGQYRLLERLGAGGMGEVFLARLEREEGFSKLLAIKRIRPELSASPRFREWFSAEARIAATLNHPHILQVVDFGRIKSTCYLAMEFIDGVDLAGLLERVRAKQQALPLPVLVGIALACLRGLQYAHGRTPAVIHGDVSPANLLLGREGEIKLLDFGIARLASPADAGGTRTAIRGKLAYLAPEVAGGEPPGPASDCFGVGAILYEMATLAPPRAPAGIDPTLSRDALAPIPPVLEKNPALPAALAHLIDRALSPAPPDRFADAAAMETALQRLAEAGQLDPSPRAVTAFVREQLCDQPARPSATLPRTLVEEVAPVRSRAREVLRWAAGILFLMILIGGAWLVWPRAAPPPPQETSPRLLSSGSLPSVEQPEPVPATAETVDAGIAPPGPIIASKIPAPAPRTTSRPAHPLPRERPTEPEIPDAGLPAPPPDAPAPDPQESPAPPETPAPPAFVLRANRAVTCRLDDGPAQSAPLTIAEPFRGHHLLTVDDGRGLSAKIRIEIPGENGPIKLAVRSTPFSVVAIDGEPRGVTPLGALELPRGVHLLTLAPAKAMPLLLQLTLR